MNPDGQEFKEERAAKRRPPPEKPEPEPDTDKDKE